MIQTDVVPAQAERVRARAVSVPVVLACGIFLVTVVRNAWLSDDAYITLRTIDNFVHGFGLRWNIAERVQAYTHPLWMFLLLPFYALTREPRVTTTLVSIGVSAAVAVALLRVAERPAPLVCLFTLLVGSKAFMEFCTGGLENPLTHLLLVLFALAFWADRRDARGTFTLWAIAALLALNRVDALLIIAPALALRMDDVRHRTPSIALALLPLVVWELFSFVYYGSLVPNTAYAKLSHGIARRDVVHQGFVYLIDSVSHDPVTLLTIGASLPLVYWLGTRRDWTLTAGALLYLLYIVWIGGDFMSGRLLTPIFLASVLQIVRVGRDIRTADWIAATVIAFLFALTPASPPLLARHEPATGEGGIEPTGIVDERMWYFRYTGLLLETRNVPRPIPGTQSTAHLAREQGVRATVKAAVGIYGYYAGPTIHIIDAVGLTDPLLARLPADPQSRVGHYTRRVPEGYLESVETGENRLKDPLLAVFYDKIRIVSRGPISSGERFKTAVLMMVGRYDKYLRSVPGW